MDGKMFFFVFIFIVFTTGITLTAKTEQTVQILEDLDMPSPSLAPTATTTSKPKAKTTLANQFATTTSKDSAQHANKISSSATKMKSSSRVGGKLPSLAVSSRRGHQSKLPSLAVSSRRGHQSSGCNVGALMPWLDKLYMISHLCKPRSGSGAGLYVIHPDLTKELLVKHSSTYYNRFLHEKTNRIIIGPWTVDLDENVQVFKQLLKHRIAATAEHLQHPDYMVYMLEMDGTLWECNLLSMNCEQIFFLPDELEASVGEQLEFKAAYTMRGRLIVASISLLGQNFTGKALDGRLAEWEGPGHEWTILNKTAFVEVTGSKEYGGVVIAMGWDSKSVILQVYDRNNSSRVYRLPTGSHVSDHSMQATPLRIREVETGRFLMDAYGLFYELSPLSWEGGTTFGVTPISRHLRVVADFAPYLGSLVLGGDQVLPSPDGMTMKDQSQSGLWFGQMDDLWNFGKPQGWLKLWRNEYFRDIVSEPFLVAGFDKKMLWVTLSSRERPDLYIEADFTGAGSSEEDWVTIEHFRSDTYILGIKRDFSSFNAKWARVRVVFSEFSTAWVTAYFVYN